MAPLREWWRRLFGGPPDAGVADLPTPDWLVLGLGNPGPRYAATRHNAGFRVVERLAERSHASWRDDPAIEARVAPCRIDEVECLLVQPQTFMNASGRTLEAALDVWPTLDPETRLLVVYDDMDLPLGRIRLRPKGGAGGHNGIGDILDRLGTRSVARLRFGVGHPGAAGPAVLDWVLSPFADEEAEALEVAIERAADAVEAAMREGVVPAMGRFNAGS